jgi:general secretion pathway protein C
MKRAPLITSFILFIALCASAAYWVMQFLQPPPRPMVAPPSAAQSAPDISAAAALLGGKSHATLDSNFQLTGIILAGRPAERIAIIAANGLPAHPFRIHAEIQAKVSVQEIQQGYVLLSDHGAIKRIDLAESTKNQIKVNPTPLAQPPVTSINTQTISPSTNPNGELAVPGAMHSAPPSALGQ